MSFAIWNSPLIGAIASMFDKLVQVKVGLWFGKLLSAVGLGFVAQEFIYDPLIDMAQQYWSQVPATLAAWVHAFGIDTAVSIIVSAYGIQGAQRIFLARREQLS